MCWLRVRLSASRRSRNRRPLRLLRRWSRKRPPMGYSVAVAGDESVTLAPGSVVARRTFLVEWGALPQSERSEPLHQICSMGRTFAPAPPRRDVRSEAVPVPLEVSPPGSSRASILLARLKQTPRTRAGVRAAAIQKVSERLLHHGAAAWPPVSLDHQAPPAIWPDCADNRSSSRGRSRNTSMSTAGRPVGELGDAR